MYTRLWSIDRRGKQPGELREPGDVCFLPSKDHIVVADAGNHRLQVGAFVIYKWLRHLIQQSFKDRQR